MQIFFNLKTNKLPSNRFNLLLFILLGLSLLALNLLIMGFWQVSPLNAQRGECAVGEAIDVTFTANSGWDLCWSINDAEGITLHDIHYTTPDGTRRKVMKEASLAQLILSPDDGSETRHLLSEAGLGGDLLLALDGNDCPNGEFYTVEERNVLCQHIVERGYSFRYFTQQRQGEYLNLFSLSQIPSTPEKTATGDQLLVEWHLYDDGTIEPVVAALHTPISSADAISGSQRYDDYVISAFWRLDIDIGANGDDDLVEEIEVLAADDNRRRSLSVTQIQTETARTVDPNSKRSWRVRAGTLANADDHVVSYQLEARNVGHRLNGNASEPWHQHQLYVTVLNPCERLATQNPAPVQAEENCAENVAEFVNAEPLAEQDPVLWYGISVHHYAQGGPIPSQTARLSFQLIPRDWSSVNPLVP